MTTTRLITAATPAEWLCVVERLHLAGELVLETWITVTLRIPKREVEKAIEDGRLVVAATRVRARLFWRADAVALFGEPAPPSPARVLVRKAVPPVARPISQRADGDETEIDEGEYVSGRCCGDGDEFWPMVAAPCPPTCRVSEVSGRFEHAHSECTRCGRVRFRLNDPAEGVWAPDSARSAA